MPFISTITVNIAPDKTYKITAPANVDVFYSGVKVWGGGANNYFIANDTNTFIVQSASTVTGSVVLTEILTNFYEAYDGAGGTWVYPQRLDKWTGKYSFRPEWMSMVANRIVSFKEGMPNIHNGTFNTFYGKVYDSAIAAVHNEDGNTVKVYNNVAVEGEIPGRMHFRTEVPNVQSSDLVTNEFVVREGVNYSDILRDRMSPNSSGTFDQKLMKGDKVRGEVCKFLYLLNQPTTRKSIKFLSIGYTPSTGQSV
jgi:hypothetical protein